MVFMQNNNRIAKNAALLYVRMFLTMFVSIYASRVILDVLGVSDFGIYNVVSGVTTIVVFFSGSLSNATQRYLNISLGKDNQTLSNNYFSQFLLIYLVLAMLVLGIGEICASWVVEHLLSIPISRIYAAKCVYHLSLIILCLTLIQIPFQSAIIAHEKMDVYAYISLLESFARLGILYVIAKMNGDSLIEYSFFLLAISLLIFVFNLIYCFVKFTECRFRYYFDFNLAKEMFSFIGYNMFGCFAYSAQMQGVNVILNIFFGPAINAARAIAMQVGNAVSKFSDNIMIAIKPSIIKLYAKDDIKEMLDLSINAARYCTFITMLVLVPVLVCINSILRLWLNVVPDFTAIFVVLILIEGIFNMINQPITTLVNATGRLKQNQFYGRIYTLLVLPLSYIALLIYKSPVIPIGLCVLASILYLINNLFDVKNQLGLSVRYFLSKTIVPCFLYIPLLGICYMETLIFDNVLICILVVLTTDVFGGFLLTYQFLLSDKERWNIRCILKRYLPKISK